MAGYAFVKRLDGEGATLITMTVGAAAAKTGDAMKIGAAQNLVIPITTVKDKVVGVALHDAGVGAQVAMVQVDGHTVFEAVGVTAAYTEATYKYVAADSGFVSGAMVVNPAVVTTTGDVLMLNLTPNYLTGVIGNHFDVIFLNRYL
jgi:hypothetical protein